MSFTMRTPTGPASVTVGHWCGGITLQRTDEAGIHHLAATPLYLDADDLLLLLGYAHGDLDEILHPEVAENLRARVQRLCGGDSGEHYRGGRDEHDRIAGYWDCQP